MIGLGSRFAEYGLTGGFFVFGQVCVFAWFFPEIAGDLFSSIVAVLPARLDHALPKAAHPAFSSLLVALALVSIFFIGLLLDLIGSVIAVWEAGIFKKELDVNTGWFAKFVETTGDQSRVDYERIQSMSVTVAELVRRYVRSYFALVVRFWRLDLWRTWFAELSRTRRQIDALGSDRALGSYHRLETLLMAYVLVSSGASSLDWLADQLRLCRTSRAVSASLLVLGSQVSISIWVSLASPPPSARSFDPLILLPQFVIGVLFFLCIFITHRAYSRFCATLFSLAYAYHRSSLTSGAAA